MQFNDEAVLDAIAERYGTRMAQNMPTIGPMVLDIMKSFDGAFRMRHVAEQMGPNGFAANSLAQRKNIALAVVRYINLSDEPLYFQRKHMSGTQAWVQLNVDSVSKSQLRDLELEHAQRSRRVIVFESERARGLMSHQSIARVPTQPDALPSHMDSMRDGMTRFMQSIGAQSSMIKDVAYALRMYDAAAQAGYITESDDMTIYDEQKLKDMLRKTFGL